MSRLKQSASGEYYLLFGRKDSAMEVAIVRHVENPNSSCGKINIGTGIFCPKELIGKRIRMKAEILEGENDGGK